jgi:hypothetical protein
MYPVPDPPYSPPPPQLNPYHISGIARDDEGRPVAGAKVIFYPWPSSLVNEAIAETDPSGVYGVTFVAGRDAVGGIAHLLTEKSGYETDDRYIVPKGPEVTQDLTVYRIKRLTAGDSTRVTVRPDDPLCGIDDDWTCRAVRITAPSSGTLSIAATLGDTTIMSGLQVGGRVYFGKTSLQVSEGNEVLMYALLYWTETASQSFIIKTSMTP